MDSSPGERRAINVGRIVSASAATVALAFGTLALIGWVTGPLQLARINPNYVPMAPSTALLTILLATALLMPDRTRAQRLVPLIIAVIVTLLASSLHVMSVLGIQLPVEHLGLDINWEVRGIAAGHMSPLTAVGLLLAALALFVQRVAPPKRVPYLAAAAVLVAMVAALSSALVVAYIINAPLLYGASLVPPAITTAIGLLGLAVALGGRLAVTYRKDFAPGHTVDRAFRARLAIATILAAVVIVAGSAVFIRVYANRYRERGTRDLMAIAALKTQELREWRKERVADAGVFFENLVVSDLVVELISDRTSPRVESGLNAWIRKVAESYGYSRVSVMDVEGHELMAYPPLSPIPALLGQHVRNAAGLDTITFRDLHRDADHDPIHMTLLAPVRSSGAEEETVGVIAIQIDPGDYLYPMLEQWPVESPTAETLIVRRDGDSVLFLNDLRFNADTALRLRLPLTLNELPSAMAIRGATGFVEGVDYRGVPVVAVVGPIDDSPWFLVARVDKSEFYAPLRLAFYGVMGGLGVLIILVAGVGIVIWQHREKTYYQELLTSERGRLQSEDRFRTTLQSIGDGVIVTDPSGTVLLLNEIAGRLTGWNVNEATGRPLNEIFVIIDEETRAPVEGPVELVLREGGIVELANHAVLVAKDGTETPIADSAAPITGDDGRRFGVVLVFRDQTIEREAQRRIVASEQLLRRLFDHMIAGFAVHEIITDTSGVPIDYRFVEVNQAFCDLTGIGPEAVGRTARQVLPGLEDDAAGWIERYGKVALNGQSERFEAYSAPIQKWFSIIAYSPEPGKFATIFTDVSDQRYREQELRLQSQILSTIGEAVIVTDPAGSVMYWNTAAEQLFGSSRQDAIGRPIGEVAPSPIASAHCRMTSASAGPDFGETSEIRATRKDGSHLTILLTETTLLDDNEDLVAIVSIARDISRREELDTRYTGLFQHTWDAILIANNNREIVDCNPAFMRLFGYSLNEILGKKTHTVYESIEEYEEMGRRLAAKPLDSEFSMVVRYRKKSGEVFPGETTASPLRGVDKSVVGFVGIIRDVSEREQMERQLIQSQKLEGLGRIAGGIAHDFNNVLAAVSGASQGLRQRTSDDASRRYLDTILSSVERGNAVTNRMLTFTRSTAPETQSVALGPFLTEFQDLATHTLPRQIEIRVVGVTDTQYVLVDPMQIQQVLFTLAVNAADAMEDSGEITIAVRPPSVWETRTRSPEGGPEVSYWCIDFCDNGSGMDEITQQQIFDPFFTTKDSTKGTGLGLAVAYRIVQIHGGWISPTSAVGDGTTMTIGLPAGGKPAPEPRSEDTFVQGNGETLLLIDDEQPILEMLEAILSTNGYQTLTAPTGRSAVELLEQHQEIELVVTDIGLPDINGKTLITMIQALYPSLPVVAMTGYVDPNLRESLMASGAKSILKKPYDINLLSRTIARLLPRKEQ